MSGRKAKLTIEFDVVSDQFPGMMYTFDDHIALIARDISRNHHYFKGIEVLSLEQGDEVLSKIEVATGQIKADKFWEED